MGWTDRQRKPRSKSGISISRRDRGGWLCIVVQISGETMKRLRWRQGDRVQIYIGNGTDAGRMRIQLDPEGVKMSANNTGGGTSIALGNLGAGSPQKATPVKWQARENLRGEMVIELDLPVWAGGRIVRDVTAAVMGR